MLNFTYISQVTAPLLYKVEATKTRIDIWTLAVLRGMHTEVLSAVAACQTPGYIRDACVVAAGDTKNIDSV